MLTDPTLKVTHSADASDFSGPATEAAIEAAVLAVHLATRDAETAGLRRAQAVAGLVKACDGNQSEAARRLGLHQTTVNKMVLRARQADPYGQKVHHLDGDPRNHETGDLELCPTQAIEGAEA